MPSGLAAIPLSHDVSILMCHYVCSDKYRRIVFDVDVDTILKEVCLEIEDRYDFRLIEIGTDKNHVNFFLPGIVAGAQQPGIAEEAQPPAIAEGPTAS